MDTIKIKTIDSTNLLLKELAEKQILEEGTVVLAENQRKGRGQGNNQWESEAGKNITCSILLYPTFLSIQRHFMLSKIVALGVKEALDHCIGEEMEAATFSIKWPNDIYFKDRKIAGILIENALTGQEFSQSIVGIGLNVNQEAFPSHIPNPVSLKQILGKEVCLSTLLEKIIRRVIHWYKLLKADQIHLVSQVYHDALYRKSDFHLYQDKNGQFRAKIQSVGDDGYLYVVTDEGEERRYAFKEIACVMK
jgi:BirA family biotin operon repressor/biotin-[acetyl-CoA-carboxylase] ligase